MGQVRWVSQDKDSLLVPEETGLVELVEAASETPIEPVL